MADSGVLPDPSAHDINSSAVPAVELPSKGETNVPVRKDITVDMVSNVSSDISNVGTRSTGAEPATSDESNIFTECDQTFNKFHQINEDNLHELDGLETFVRTHFGDSLYCYNVKTSKGDKVVSIWNEISGHEDAQACFGMKFLPLFYIIGTIDDGSNLNLRLITFHGKVIEEIRGSSDQPLSKARTKEFIEKLRHIKLCQGVKSPDNEIKYDLRTLSNLYLIDYLETDIIVRSRYCHFAVSEDSNTRVCDMCGSLNSRKPIRKRRKKISRAKENLTICDDGIDTFSFESLLEDEYLESRKPRIKVEIDENIKLKVAEEDDKLSSFEQHTFLHSEINNVDEGGGWKTEISEDLSGTTLQNRTKMHKCKYCGYLCDKKHELLQHVKENHSDLKPYACETCPFKAKDKRALDHHIISNHDQSKAYLCEHCSYSTPSKGRLTCHIKAVHDKFKPFICEHCSFATAAKAHLDNHIAVVHNKIKPFKCSQCPYRAANSRDMKRHVKEVHEKVRPFSCHLCPYKAGRRVLMSKHMTKMHNENKLPTRKVKYNKAPNPNSNLGYYKNKSDYDLLEFKADDISFSDNN